MTRQTTATASMQTDHSDSKQTRQTTATAIRTRQPDQSDSKHADRPDHSDSKQTRQTRPDQTDQSDSMQTRQTRIRPDQSDHSDSLNADFNKYSNQISPERQPRATAQSDSPELPPIFINDLELAQVQTHVRPVGRATSVEQDRIFIPTY